MTAKEKAIELFDKMSFETHKYNAKHCAIIAINEVKNNLPLISDIQQYWIEVEQEIELL